MRPGQQILERAAALISGDRQDDYGDALENHERIARLWNARLHDKLKDGEKIEAWDVSACMRMVKEARLIQSPGHEDTLTDIAGYTGVEMNMFEKRDA